MHMPCPESIIMCDPIQQNETELMTIFSYALGLEVDFFFPIKPKSYKSENQAWKREENLSSYLVSIAVPIATVHQKGQALFCLKINQWKSQNDCC